MVQQSPSVFPEARMRPHSLPTTPATVSDGLSSATADASASDHGARLGWADAAKGVCIALVVLHHLVTKHYDLALPGDGAVEGFWVGLTEALKPVRMPLFFVISGMFAAGAVRRPWRSAARRRIATPYYLYAVWLGIHAAVFTVATALPMNRTRSLSELLGDLAIASTQLWYLYALALYFVLAKLLLRLDARWVLLAAAALSASTSLLPIEAANRESVLQHLVYFLAGVFFPDVPRRIAELRGRRVTAGLAAAFVGSGAIAFALDLPQSSTTLIAALTGVPLAIRLVVAASRQAWFDGPAAALGRRTLPVYVMHIPVLSLLHAVVVPQLPTALFEGPTLVVAAIYPLVGAAAVTGVCLVLHTVLSRSGLGFLFSLPAGRTVERSPSRS